MASTISGTKVASEKSFMAAPNSNNEQRARNDAGASGETRFQGNGLKGETQMQRAGSSEPTPSIVHSPRTNPLIPSWGMGAAIV
ncbi:MAG: hypothetical protein JO141_33495 [Bradyrhizobium sp.]|nr:hypothetical protein [Bradyrhizobium sp.]